MMKITFKGLVRPLSFTFNSFKYMEEFDISILNEVETKPFKIVQVLTQLLYGALNSNPKEYVSEDDVTEFLEEYIETGVVTDLLEELVNLLQESSFFKSLQKNQ